MLFNVVLLYRCHLTVRPPSVEPDHSSVAAVEPIQCRVLLTFSFLMSLFMHVAIVVAFVYHSVWCFR